MAFESRETKPFSVSRGFYDAVKDDASTIPRGGSRCLGFRFADKNFNCQTRTRRARESVSLMPPTFKSSALLEGGSHPKNKRAVTAAILKRKNGRQLYLLVILTEKWW